MGFIGRQSASNVGHDCSINNLDLGFYKINQDRKMGLGHLDMTTLPNMGILADKDEPYIKTSIGPNGLLLRPHKENKVCGDHDYRFNVFYENINITNSLTENYIKLRNDAKKLILKHNYIRQYNKYLKPPDEKADKIYNALPLEKIVIVESKKESGTKRGGGKKTKRKRKKNNRKKTIKHRKKKTKQHKKKNK